MPDYSSPVVLRSSKCTVEDFVSLDPTPEPWVTPDPLNYPILTCVCQCNAIHRSITEQFKSAVVYGKSVKHQPQRVGLSHELADEDIGTWRLTQFSACRHTNRPSQSPSSSGKPRKSRTGWPAYMCHRRACQTYGTPRPGFGNPRWGRRSTHSPPRTELHGQAGCRPRRRGSLLPTALMAGTVAAQSAEAAADGWNAGYQITGTGG